ncbi:TPA: hypothetical protein ACHDU8_001341, partial [Campylobacter jejuni]
ASNTATSQISQLKDTSLNAVNEAKNTATSEISSKKEEALEEFSQATSEFNSTKEEALSQIEQAKTEQGEKITALEQAKTEQESSITELKESVSTQGQKITEIEENNTAQGEKITALEQAKTEQGEKITALEQAKESITADLNKKSKLLTENLTWNVGSGGDYEDLQTAINEASKYVTKNRVFITLNLLQNFSINGTITIGENIQKNIIIAQQDYNAPILTSEDIDNVFNILGSIYFKGCYFKENGNSKKTTLFNINGGRYEDFTYATPTKCENYNNAFKLQFASLNNIYATQQINCNNGISSSSGSISYISSNSNLTANIAFNTLTQNGIIFK